MANPLKHTIHLTALVAIFAVMPALAGDTTPAAQLAQWETTAGQRGDPTRGQTFFTQKHGKAWSCASCHGAPPSKTGEHADTGKRIKPLAPAYNDTAFTKLAKTDKWFRRNCQDVVGRECNAAEKADVLSYLIGVK